MEQYLKLLQESDRLIFKNIEDIRDRIRNEALQVNVIDYGAGDPNDKRSEQVMSQGVLKQVNTKELCHIGLKNEYAHLLYALVKKFQPKTVLELGSCCGFSAIYMSKAAQKESTIHTIEGSPETAKLAQKNFSSAHCINIKPYIGKFNDILLTLLDTIKPLDFVFIDGHHDRDATLAYYQQIKPFLNDKALVMFDDISWSEGMKEAWSIIKKDKYIENYEDFHKIGLCFFNKDTQ